jgi:hypothetical protein
MQHGYRSTAALLLIAVLTVGAAACSGAAVSGEEETTSDAVKLEPVQGSDVSRVILSPKAVERLGIKTDQIRDARLPGRRLGGGAAAGPVTTRRVVPYPAVLYDENGDTWTFTSPAPLTFVRQRIDVDYITGGMAVLLDGPPAGTRVVTVGAIELLGAELGVGE